jgi:hypothetical protein
MFVERRHDGERVVWSWTVPVGTVHEISWRPTARALTFRLRSAMTGAWYEPSLMREPWTCDGTVEDAEATVRRFAAYLEHADLPLVVAA